MCGIIGIISSIDIQIIDRLISSLKQLQNRGYDSAGICYLENNMFHIHKYASTDKHNALDILKSVEGDLDLHMRLKIGIGHNRWATHGPKNDINAHPHTSNDKSIVLVHNGIIENYSKIKNMLTNNGYTFYSDTDTEVIVNLLQYCRNGNKDASFKEVIKMTIEQLNGTYALVILNRTEPTMMYCVRNGSPLLVGHDSHSVYVCSEQSGFCGKVNTYITLQNNDICVIDSQNSMNIYCDQCYDKKSVNYIDDDLTPAPYDHWTIKEIYEQPQKILNAINLGGRILDRSHVKLGGCDENIDYLKNIDNIVLLGCGTSYHACMYSRYLFKLLCNFNTVTMYDGADFDFSDIPKKGRSLMILVSQSGETRDLYRCIDIAKKHNIFTFGVVNVVDSQISRDVNCGIYCNAGREMGVASTKAFTNQVVCLILLACWFSQTQNINETLRLEVIRDLQNLSLDFENCLNSCLDQIHKILPLLDRCEHLFLLGKSGDEAIAREGSLKIKEISYIHSEAYSASALKHGPFALLDSNVPVILLNSIRSCENKVMNCYEEVSSRGSPIILVTNNSSLNRENSIIVPYNKTFSSLICIVPLQLIAYHLSVNRGIDPDTPRNLAKVVTVE